MNSVLKKLAWGNSFGTKVLVNTCVVNSNWSNLCYYLINTGPTSPERIRYQIHGNNVDLQWEPPRITNGPLKDYDVSIFMIMYKNSLKNCDL